MASAQNESCLSHYRKLLIELSLALSSKDLEMLTFATVDFIPRGRIENIRTGLHFFDVLEQDTRIGPRNVALLQDMFGTIGRVDLARRIQAYLTRSVKVESDGERDTITTDGGGDNIPENTETSQAEPVQVAKSEVLTSSVQLVHQPLLHSTADSDSAPVVFSARSGEQRTPQVGQCLAVMRNDVSSSAGNNQGPSSELMVPAPAPSHSGKHRGAQALSSGRVQHDPSVGPAPVRYVNFLACGGYTVEIIGGKHFKTPEGEFVELKSGTQYKIHVKNTRAYGCNLDISIDGYDVGGWVIDGNQELSIERPVTEAKKFTFYRVKKAPKKAGIESGRSENGVVKCVFTPEAFLNIPVVISSSLQPLDMNMPPSATVGDLKREVQSQLGKGLDPDQVLVLGNRVLSNSRRLRNLLEQLQASGNLRLIDVEMQIKVKTSSSKTFPVKLHPGKAKVHDLMEQIERELDVPSGDQKLYLGSCLLSEAPWKRLPPKLICNPQPTVDVKVPEYIDITVEDQNSDSHTVKIDKEKSLTALVKEIPSCSYLQENEEAIFFFNGKPLLPSKDEGTFTSLGLCSGSKLELKVNVAFLQIFVDVWFSNHAISIRCSPEETFKDLVKKVETKSRKRNLEKVTFAMDGRIFDPEKDKGPLQGYEIKHRSQLQMRLVRPTPEVNTVDDSRLPLEADVLQSLKESGDKLKKVLELQQMALDQVKCSHQEVGSEGTEEKESFLSAFKRKLGFGKQKEMTGPPSPPPSRNANASVDEWKGYDSVPWAQCGQSKLAVDEWEDYDVERQGSAKSADEWKGYDSVPWAQCGQSKLAVDEWEDYDVERQGSAKSADEWKGYDSVPVPQCGQSKSADEWNGYDSVPWAQCGQSKLAVDEWEGYDMVAHGSANSADEWEDYDVERQGSAKSAEGVKSILQPTPQSAGQETGCVTERDPGWRAGGTTLQGYSTQQFMNAEPIKVDPSRKVELVLRLVAREDEEDLIFPEDECKPLSTLYPPAVPE